jgi:peptidoglycan/xylan/chitin deacetylase (PgdA/CDA1 family)
MGGVALTFDDGPDPRGTPAVLDALARAGVRPASRRIARAHGLRWTADSGDWRGDTVDAMLASIEVRDGAIVLMHDGASRARHTAALIGPLVHAVRAKGLETGRIGLSGSEPTVVGEGKGMDSRGGACGGVGGAGHGAGRQ